MKTYIVAFLLVAAAVRAEGGTITTSDGATIHYLESGKGPAILFVPGWTIAADIFEPQLAYFGRNWRAVAMDPRAHGESSKTGEGHDMATRGRDIKAVIDQLKLSPVVLVGWSNGVTEVAAYLDQFGTAGVAGLVFIDGTAGGNITAEMREARNKTLSRMFTDRRAFTESFVRSMYKKPQSEAYIASVVHAVMKMPTAMAITTGLTASLVDYRPALAKIDKPTLMVVAQSPFMAWFEDMRGRIPNVRYEVLDGVGHAIFADDPPRFNALLDEFVKPLR